MLKYLYIISKIEYVKELLCSAEYQKWMDEMRDCGLKVFYTNSCTDVEKWICLKKESLFLTDDNEIIKYLKSQECGIIAWYHLHLSENLIFTEMAVQDLNEIEWDFLVKIYERYRGIPWKIAETKRLLIREMAEADLEDLYQLYANKEVTRFIEDLYPNKEDELKYIKDYIKNIYAYYGFGMWLLIDLYTGELIGRAGLSYRPGYDEAELGYVIGKQYWRKAYAIEACLKILELGRDIYELRRVQAFTQPENIASISLLEKMNFKYQEDVILDGKIHLRYLKEL